MSAARLPRLLAGMAFIASLSGSALADDLGRLFTNAADRARIDALRVGMPQQDSTTDTIERVVLNGTLRGSDGKRVVWLNGAAIDPSNARDMSLLHDGRVQLSWREGTRILKPGQGIDEATGEVFEYHTPVPAPAPTPTDTNKEKIAQAKPEDTAATATTAKDASDATPAVPPDPKAKPK